MCIKASFSHSNDVEFDIGDTAPIVDENQNPEQDNLTTTTQNGATPEDSLTPTWHLAYTKKYIKPLALSWLRWYSYLWLFKNVECNFSAK